MPKRELLIQLIINCECNVAAYRVNEMLLERGEQKKNEI